VGKLPTPDKTVMRGGIARELGYSTVAMKSTILD
jgi:hypothetical protein